MSNQRDVPLQQEIRAYHDARQLGRRRDNIRDDHVIMRLKKMRSNNVSKAKPGEGKLSKEIIDGTYTVRALEDSEDTIGAMVYRCTFCGALKYLRETLSMCCMKGMLKNLPVFKRPTPEIERLIHGTSEESNVFRKMSRTINNGVSMSSLSVQPQDYLNCQGVIFQGKIYHSLGPRDYGENDTPKFAQMYIHDSVDNTTLRYENLYLPPRTSRREKEHIKAILEAIVPEIKQFNPFARDFKLLKDLPAERFAEGKVVISAKHRPQGTHEGVYNEFANASEISVLTDGNSNRNDIVIHQTGGVRSIPERNYAGMPLRFTLLFPRGTHGWEEGCGSLGDTGRSQISPREFYNFHMMLREGTFQNFIHKTGRLFQEWVCMAWIQAENNSLNYIRLHQKEMRCDQYDSVRNAVNNQNQERIGKPVILTSSFSGSPRWYAAKYQNGLAICREYRKPDFFITMTCNPNWEEIKSNLLPNQTAQDRPDLTSRVFNLKKHQLVDDFVKGGIFGRVVALMYTIEFQKRGLPHCHLLIILEDDDRIQTHNEVDKLVTAELPPDPNDPTISALQKENRQKLQDLVSSQMIHGPCGSQCLKDGKCSKNFPKEYQRETTINPETNYAIYKRRKPTNGGRSLTIKRGGQDYEIDNRWIVPYNPYLLLKYDCHINVECCTSNKVAKYLYKYVTKGNTRAMVNATINGNDGNDEIENYIDMRVVGSCEAAWRLMDFHLQYQYPAVIVLRVHLEDQQQLMFEEGTEIANLETFKETELTAFFRLNALLKADNAGLDRMPTYVDMPKQYVYQVKNRKWELRKKHSDSIGRVHSVGPGTKDLYYMRMLLHHNHCRGKTSFADLKTINGQLCETYQSVCERLGLLEGDAEYVNALEEASHTKMSPQIRRLFVMILVFCNPDEPKALFERFWETWKDDYEQTAQSMNVELDEEQLKTLILQDIESNLAVHEKTLADYRLPNVTIEDLRRVQHMTNIQPTLFREELDFDVPLLREEANQLERQLTNDQRDIFNCVIRAVEQRSDLRLFIDARGGCGKTYLLNTILKSVRSMSDQGEICLAMASTGIAANLLHMGRTYHSRLKAPLTPKEDSILDISVQSNLAKVIQKAKLIIIDESTMIDSYMLSAIDRTLRDVMNNKGTPFGGKIVILAGDFRQCLPVIKSATPDTISQRCINSNGLWAKFTIKRLITNMRVNANQNPDLHTFDNWTLDIGNGIQSKVRIPENMIALKISSETDAMHRLIGMVFPDINVNISNPEWLIGRAVLAVTNRQVNALNKIAMQKLNNLAIQLESTDRCTDQRNEIRHNPEYLHTLTPDGFPPHTLMLKPGVPLILLRNLNPKQGLCNGTKLIFNNLHSNRVLECTVVETQEKVLIPRIRFIPLAESWPEDWHRIQFPVKVAFAFTINKSQGQTMQTAGLFLRPEVFTHGQLYVAISRVRSPEHLKIALVDDYVNNIVFKDVLI